MEKEKGMHKKIEKKEEKRLLFDKIKGNIGVGTVLKRIYNGITTDLLLWHKPTQENFFLELNTKHIHEGKNQGIKNC